MDFTGDYRQRLVDLDPVFLAPTAEQGIDLEAKLFAVETGSFGGHAEKAILKESIDSLREQTEGQVADFLRNDANNLAIFELAEIANTKATLRLTELYLSSHHELGAVPPPRSSDHARARRGTHHRT